MAVLSMFKIVYRGLVATTSSGGKLPPADGSDCG